MSFRSKRFAGVFCVSILSIFCVPAGAAPYFNQPWRFEQPDGSSVEVILNGDEFYMEAQTPDRYTVVRDEQTGWICYAELSADGSELVSTGVPYDAQAEAEAKAKLKEKEKEKAISPGRTVRKKLTIKDSAKLKKVREKKDHLFGEDVEGIRGLMYPGETAEMTAAEPYPIESAPQAAAAGPMPPTKDFSRYNTTIRGLVLVFDFSDAPAQYTLTQYNDKVNKPNAYKSNGNAASLRTYYADVSRGTFIMDHVVYGIFRAPNTFAYYDSLNYAQGARELMSFGLNQMEADGFDFSQLSTNSSGEIKALAVMYTGSPAAWAEGMWYHASGWGGFSADGVRTGPYCTDSANNLDPGTLIHEHGHMAANWPDTYSYINGEPGTWGVMGGGYCDLPNPYFLYENGWLDSENLLGVPGLWTMYSADAHFAYCYYDPAQPTEFYFIRPYTRSLLYCPDIPDQGLTIWRVNTQGDNAQFPNTNRHIELVHANNVDTNKTSNVCFRAGGLLDHFTSTTTPSSNWKYGALAGEPSGMDITNISAAGGTMTFVMGTVPQPAAYYPLNGSFGDASGNGHVAGGTNFSGSYWTSDVFTGSYFNLSQALRLDGMDDYATCPAAVGASDALTVMCWVKPETAASMIVLDKFPADGLGAGWRLELGADGRAGFVIGSQTNHTRVTTPGPVYEPGRWVHLACTFANGTAKVFVNGALRAMRPGIAQTVNTAALEVRMGRASQVDTNLIYQGCLDDVRFYHAELDTGPLSTIDGLSFRPDAGILAFLKLDETGGTTAADASGHGYDGQLNGALAFGADSVPGPVGQALLFDGVDDHIQLTAGMRKLRGGFTVALWAYPTAVKNWSRFIDFGNGSSSDNIVLGRYMSTNDLFFEVYNGSSGGGKVRAAGAIELNKWQFFAATVDASGIARLYKNGQLLTATGSTVMPPEVYRSRLYVGKSNWSGDDYYQGAMDDIRVYNHALSAAEVASLHANSRMDGPVPFSGADGVSPEVTLSFTPAGKALRHDIYFGTQYHAVAAADPSSAEYRGRTSACTYNPPALDARRDYFWRVDTLMRDGTIQTGPVWRFTTGGGIQRQVWTGLSSADTLTSLKNHADYPDHPTLVTELSQFAIPTDWSDAYGTRVHGLLLPQTSGSYRFWISGDNEVELWLSSSANPANVSRIAYIHGTWSSPQNFDQHTSQRSGLISLTAGQAYYIMALHKEGSGGDHMAVAWQGPDSPDRSIIDGFWMRPPVENEWPVFASVGATPEAAEGAPFTAALPTTASDPDGDSLQYRKMSGPAWLRVAADGQLSGMPQHGDAGVNSFTIQAEDGRGGFGECVISVSVADRYTGAMGIGDLAGFAQEWLSADISSPANLDAAGGVSLNDLALFSEQWNRGLVEGLVAHWALDDCLGLTARDRYAHHHGSLVNMSEYSWVPGIKGNALAFDGADDFVRIDGFKGVTGDAARTVAFWVKTDDATCDFLSWGRLNDEGGATLAGQKWQVLCYNGELGAIVQGGNVVCSAPELANNQWHHVAITLDDFNGDGAVNIDEGRLYVDGVLKPTGRSLPQAVNTAAYHDVHIGKYPEGGTQQFGGLLDDVRIYDRALSGAEIHDLAAWRLAAYWKLDETSGTAAADSSGFGRNGTLTGMASNWVPGIKGNALAFDGVDDYVRVEGYKGVDGDGARTCAFWVKTTDAACDFLSWGRLYGEGGAVLTGQKWQVLCYNGELGAVVQGGNVVCSAPELADNQWRHVAITLDDFNGDGTVNIDEGRLYVDGVLKPTSRSLPQAVNTAAYHDVHIGKYPEGGTQHFGGLLDEVRIYDRALSEAEVSALVTP